MMCIEPSSSRDLSEFFDMHLPSLEGIRVPPLEESSLHDSHLPINSCPVHPTLNRIDTSWSLGIEVRSNDSTRPGHKHSRSRGTLVNSAPPSAPERLNDAFETFLSPTTNHSDSALPPSSLPGLYISHSSRKNSVPATTTNSVFPSVYDFYSRDAKLHPSSPVYDAEECGESEGDFESEDVWNLIPYDISWGPAYHGYRQGTLPGPDGRCLFLRSPTPLKYQRTGQACEKCRERKAKCSGARPSCTRCVMRGLTCVYSSDPKRVKSDDSSDEGDICMMPSHDHLSGALRNSGAIRARRNTDCGPFVPRRIAPLKRRHSTVGPSYSAALSEKSRRRPSRETRMGTEAGEANDQRRLLGACEERLIVLPENSMQGDDQGLSENTRLSYRSLHQVPAPVGPWANPVHSKLEPGTRGDWATNTTSYSERLDRSVWDLQSLPCDALLHDSTLLSIDSPSSELSEEQTSCASGQGYNVVDGTPYTDRCPDDVASSGGEATLNGQDVPFEYDILIAPYSGISNSSNTATYEPITQPKVEQGCFMEVDSPYIVLPSHTADVYNFDHFEGVRMPWFATDDS